VKGGAVENRNERKEGSKKCYKRDRCKRNEVKEREKNKIKKS
jgi:hypothetical protein